MSVFVYRFLIENLKPILSRTYVPTTAAALRRAMMGCVRRPGAHTFIAAVYERARYETNVCFYMPLKPCAANYIAGKDSERRRRYSLPAQRQHTYRLDNLVCVFVAVAVVAKNTPQLCLLSAMQR